MARIYKIPKSPYWYIYYKYRGRRFRRSLGTTSRHAAEIIKRRYEDILAEDKNPLATGIGFAKLLDEYIVYCETYNQPKTLYNKKLYVARFLKFFRDVPIKHLSRADVEAYITTRRQTAGSPTVNRELATLKHALAYAVNRGSLERNPAAGVKLLPERKRAIRILSDEELHRYFTWCLTNDPLLYDLSIIAFNTGLRRGDILKIRGEDIDTQRDRLTVSISKRRGEKVLYLPLNSEARAVLTHLKKPSYIFPGPTGHLTDFKKRFHRALRETRLNFRFADFRHNCAVALFESGAEIRTVQTILGHAAVTTTEKHYLPIIEKMQRDALSRMKKVSQLLPNNPAETLHP